VDELLGGTGVTADNLVLLNEMDFNTEFIDCGVILNVSVLRRHRPRRAYVFATLRRADPDLFHHRRRATFLPQSPSQ
jgi:hypothetical protein